MKHRTDTKATDEVLVDYQSRMEALNRLHCIIELNLDGTIITANPTVLELLGYTLKEVKDKHHQIFLDSMYADSTEYQDIWKSVQQAESVAGDCKWLSKKGNEIWLQVSYNLIYDKNTKPLRIMLLGRDVTDSKIKSLKPWLVAIPSLPPGR